MWLTNGKWHLQAFILVSIRIIPLTIFNLFSKRQKEIRGELPDIFTYDNLPDKLRAQIVHIIRDAIGTDHGYDVEHASSCYKFVNDALCREKGVFELTKHSSDIEQSVINYFLIENDHEQAIDVVELCFQIIDTYARKHFYTNGTKVNMTPDEAIDELNARFKEHGIGYSFESGEIIRVDSKYLHSEVVKPTLKILHETAMYKNANNEFLSAHKHYRHGRNKECLNDCLKAFESVLKVICDNQKWHYKKTDTAKKLIDICFESGLIPNYMQSQMSALRSLLESGIPTVRNKMSSHGQGVDSITVSPVLTSYALHLTATNILFLAEQEGRLE